MPDTVTIHVHYPRRTEQGRLCLRTELDWDRSETASEERDGVFTFQVATERSFFYCKPILEGPSGERWSVGSNYLALKGEQAKEIYPFFEGSLKGTLTETVALQDERGSAHRARFYLPPGYDENQLKRYPVLYMHDGGNLFFPEEAFTGVEAGCMSSTFGYQDDLEARVHAGDLKDVRIYLDSGWPEDNFERTLSMRNALIRAGRVFGRDFLYFAFPGAQHDESSWAVRTHLPFQFFFGNMPGPAHLGARTP